MEECPACAERWLDWAVAWRLDDLLTELLAAGAEVATRHFDDTPEAA
jgi:hypothetical protein